MIFNAFNLPLLIWSGWNGIQVANNQQWYLIHLNFFLFKLSLLLFCSGDGSIDESTKVKHKKKVDLNESLNS